MTNSEFTTHKAYLAALFVTKVDELAQRIQLGRRGALIDGQSMKVILMNEFLKLIDAYILPEVGEEGTNSLTPTEMEGIQEKINYMFGTSIFVNWYKQ